MIAFDRETGVLRAEAGAYRVLTPDQAVEYAVECLNDSLNARGGDISLDN